MNFKRFENSPLAAMALALAFGLWGLSWGLPSKERAQLFLRPEMQTQEFYRQLAAARNDLYNKIGENPFAYYGRQGREHKARLEASGPLSLYGTFLLRSHHGDEQMVLVALSNLNPLKGRWYPELFSYGGAYLYPLAAYMGAAHVLHLIRLVPDVTFYYANPDQMGKVYLAARTWSVIGMMFSAIPLFLLGKRLAGSFAGFLASCFYVLSPASIAIVKIAKPHVWAAGWTLAMIYGAIHAKEDPRFRVLALAGFCFGIALGNVVSQCFFIPFLIWTCITPSFRKTLERLVVAGTASLAGFVLTNFYVLSHFQDFRDEVYHNSLFFPFSVTARSLWAFLWSGMRVSLGSFLWLFAVVGLTMAFFQKSKKPYRAFVVLIVTIFAYLAFLLQGWDCRPMFSRYFLTLIGLWSFFAAYAIDQLPGKRLLGGLLLGWMVFVAARYDQNYASDKVPYDNPSLASLWIRDHVPAGGIVAQDHFSPHPVDFPPIDFARYRIIDFHDPEFKNPTGPAYAVVYTWIPDLGGITRQTALDNHYTLVKAFAESPMQKRGEEDPFMPENFPIEIYARP